MVVGGTLLEGSGVVTEADGGEESTNKIVVGLEHHGADGEGEEVKSAADDGDGGGTLPEGLGLGSGTGNGNYHGPW